MSRITRYCKICGGKIDDKTRGNNKKICDKLECKEKSVSDKRKKYMKRYWRKNREKYQEQLLKNRIKNGKIIKWRCQDCEKEVILTFDPRKRFTTEKLLSLICKNCGYENKKTAD